MRTPAFFRPGGLGCIIAVLLAAPFPGNADPCGMVPPIYTGPGKPIERIGEQMTYVFYDKGIETIAIRPGFKGKVDEFGMLIPFPTPPAIRKLPDNFFSHIAAAIDPPEVVMHVNRYRSRPRRSGGRNVAMEDKDSEKSLRYDEVRVLRQEAVGMYEVAVLEAGSARALQRWMTQHKYRYPEGMDKPANDYVKAGWCFVAVKTRVGQKLGVDPKPGQRAVTSKLPPSATFDGHVQAMGFRFRSKEPILPMRLSAFNGGRMRNIVYLVTRGAKRIAQIPEKYVMRQLSGWTLARNAKLPLPLRVIGGTIRDLRPYQKAQLKRLRKPGRHMKHAIDLLASDAHAVRRGRLSNPIEQTEKALLEVGERLDLRGSHNDEAIAAVLARRRNMSMGNALRSIHQLTMTVIDGDFRRDVVANHNLTFLPYRMPRDRNNRRSYDARVRGPAPERAPGTIYRTTIDSESPSRYATRSSGVKWFAGCAFGVLAALLALRRA